MFELKYNLNIYLINASCGRGTDSKLKNPVTANYLFLYSHTLLPGMLTENTYQNSSVIV